VSETQAAAPLVTPPAPPADDNSSKYRDFLLAAEQKSTEEYDKAIMALSGGALVASMAFVKDIAGPTPVELHFLVLAWLSWVISLSTVLVSYYMSHLALRRAVAQLDAEKIHDERPGAYYDTLLAWMNPLAGVVLLLGFIFFGFFALNNLVR
jgi:hypothetical protein